MAITLCRRIKFATGHGCRARWYHHLDEDMVAASRVREFEAKVRELERLLGRKTMEAEILREAMVRIPVIAIGWSRVFRNFGARARGGRHEPTEEALDFRPAR